MSQHNVDLVLASVDAFNAGDMDGWAAFFAPDMEVVQETDGAAVAPGQGRDTYRAFVEEVIGVWRDARFEAIETHSVGSDRALVRAEWSGEAKASGIKAAVAITTLDTIRDGQIVRREYYFDHERALRAAGLTE
jgi:ketosteroid isomerase-like protein